MSLQVDFHSAAGVKLDVPPLLGSDIFAHSYTLALNRIGNFSLTVAADSEAAAQATMGRQLWVYRNNEGLLFKGVVEDIETTVAADGSTRLVITGRSTAALLTWKTTLLGRTFDNVTLSSLVSTLLSSSGFTAGSIDSPSTNITTRFDGRNLWDALVFAGEVFGLNVREDNLSTEIDIGAFGTSSGITLRNLDELSPALANNPYMVPITSIRKRSFALDIANKVIPIGQQSGIAGSSVWFTLAQSTRSSPYTIGSATGPDGQTYYYIEDTTSQATYGTRERVLQVRDILPLGVATADFQRAANTLYDEAVTYLQRHKDAQTAYDVDVVGLSHISGAAYRFQVGDKMRLQFTGTTQDADGRRTYLSVDTDLYVMEFTRSFDASGADTWKLTLSSITREMPNDGNITARFLSELHAVKAAPMPYVLFGDNVARFSEAGLDMVTASDPEIDGSNERKVSWTSSDFLTRYAEIFGSRNTGLGYNYLTTKVKKATDAQVYSGIYDSSGTEWDIVQIVSQSDGGFLEKWGVKEGLSTVLYLDRVSATDWKLWIMKNSTLVEVGGAMKVQNDGYEVYPAAAAGVDPASSGGTWTNGAWSQVVASTGSAIYVVGFTVGGAANAAGEFEMDIGTGAAAAEAVKATTASWMDSAILMDFVTMLPYPIAVASGTRIAVRQRSSSTVARVVNVKLIYVEQANLVSL